MVRRRIAWMLALGAVVCASSPRPASAQLGGLIKKKVKQAVEGQSGSASAAAPAAPSPAAPAGPRFNEYVLELTSSNLDKFQVGLAAEKAYRDSVYAVYARMKTPREYQQCTMTAMMSPDGQKLVHGDMRTTEAMQEAGLKLKALMTQRCGPDPSSGSEKEAALYAAPAHSAAAAGLTEEQYGIIKERVKPFCGEGGGAARIAGSGGGIYYVYSETEIAALQPRCAKLVALMDTKPQAAGRRVKPQQ